MLRAARRGRERAKVTPQGAVRPDPAGPFANGPAMPQPARQYRRTPRGGTFGPCAPGSDGRD